MRVAIFSDIHANLEALEATLKAISAEAVDRVICLGDIVGYNANPAECVALIRAFAPLCIAGNHDRAVTGQITTEGFSITAARAIKWTRARLAADAIDFLAGLPLKLTLDDRLVAVHGALHPVTGCELVPLDTAERRRLSFQALVAHPSGAHVCVFGHTHHLGVFELRDGVMRERSGDEVALADDAYYLMNPGTVGQPRTAERRATYFVLDLDGRVLSVRRVPYDASVTASKTRTAGLLPRSSLLPAPIRAPLARAARALKVDGFLKRSGW